MRVIDADKLLEAFREKYEGRLGMENSDLMITFRNICKIINQQPVINATCESEYVSKYCDNKCDYANVASKINSYGGIDTVEKCMEGKAVPLTMLNEENIDDVYRVVYAAKHGII